MCLILFAYRVLPMHSLIVAANRDELYARPTTSADWWAEAPGLLAGRDQQAGGTWLGIQASGRFAAITNFTDPEAPLPARSRGVLPVEFLCGDQTASEYSGHIEGERYQGFNLLLWDGRELVCTSNRGNTEVVAPGYYGLTNAPLGAQWPKAVDGIARLKEAIAQGITGEALIKLLHHQGAADEYSAEPNEVESRFTPCFISGEVYGTRASTAVIYSDNAITMIEQTYGPSGQLGERRSFSFRT